VKKKLLLLFVSMVFLSGCAPKAINLDPSFWSDHQQTVAVAHATLKQGETYTVGNDGLLGHAFAYARLHTFEHYVQHNHIDTMQAFQARLLKQLKHKHVKAFVVDQAIDLDKLPRDSRNDNQFAAYNLSSIRTQVDATHVLMVSVTKFGAERKANASIFTSNSNPKAVCTLKGELVDLQTNHILWRHTFETTVTVPGKWDQPPNYPNFHRALVQAVNGSMDDLVAQLFSD
jgi:ABC-type uncharacterized transport system auxiliary subunit